MRTLFNRRALYAFAFVVAITRASGSPVGADSVTAARGGGIQTVRTPLAFEPNVGQADARVRYLARAAGETVFLTDRDVVVALPAARGVASTKRFRVRFAGAASRIEPLEPLSGVSHYLTGTGTGRSKRQVPHFGAVRYHGVARGVDVIFHGRQRQLEWDFVVAPGADPRAASFELLGTDRIDKTPAGDLVVGVGDSTAVIAAPVAYQGEGDSRRTVAAEYEVRANRIKIRVGPYDPARPLVIDPVLSYSTYLGGSGFERSNGAAVAADGSLYLTGVTTSADFPLEDPIDSSFSGPWDVFVAKLSPDGSTLEYATFLGGSGFDEGIAIALDAMGDIYVTGSTTSTNFPTTLGAFQTSLRGPSDCFVTKLASTGASILYSTYLGGTGTGSAGRDQCSAVAVDSAGRAHVTGDTNSSTFPVVNAFDSTYNSGATNNTDTFVTKLNALGSGLVYSTYLGGTFEDTARGIAVDTDGSVIIGGSSESSNFPTTTSAEQPVKSAGMDAFVTKLTPAGNLLVFSTFLGGSGFDFTNGLRLGPGGIAHVIGGTSSADFPTVIPLQPTYAGGFDAFIARLDATGVVLYSSYFGGPFGDVARSLAVAADGTTYLGGDTGGGMSLVTPTQAGFAGGGVDGFVASISPLGSLTFATYLGGSGFDSVLGMALDGDGGVYVTGSTSSSDFPVVAPAAQAAYAGGSDAFAAKIEFARPPATLSLSPAAATNAVGTQHCVTATVRDVSGNPTPDITVRFSVMGTTAASGSATTDGSGQASFCYGGPTTPGADALTAFADTNHNAMQDVDEPGGAATKTWVAGAPATLALSPPAASNPVNTLHCVTAAVQDAFANPTPAVTLRFSVAGAVTTTGSATTDGNGQATFCYNGPTTLGADAIAAYADTNANATRDAGEPSGAATKTWFVPLPTSIDQCKNGGWETFGVFKNQGDCVSFVSTKKS